MNRNKCETLRGRGDGVEFRKGEVGGKGWEEGKAGQLKNNHAKAEKPREVLVGEGGFLVFIFTFAFFFFILSLHIHGTAFENS